MALVTRVLTNAGSPLYTQDGVLLSNTKITFTLINKNGVVGDAFDSVTGERVAPIDQSVYTNVDGEFLIELWCNSRSTPVTYYACSVDFPRVPVIYGVIPEGLDDFGWLDFKLSLSELTIAELSALEIHKQDNNKHLSSSEKQALSSSNSPSALNPIATMNDIAIAGGHIHSNKEVLDKLTDEDGTLFYNGSPIQGSSSISAITSSSGELVAPSISTDSDGNFYISWDIVGTSQAAPDVIISSTGERLQAVVTNGGEGQYFVEWRVI